MKPFLWESCKRCHADRTREIRGNRYEVALPSCCTDKARCEREMTDDISVISDRDRNPQQESEP